MEAADLVTSRPQTSISSTPPEVDGVPEVSVIVPARNEEGCLAGCLRSLVGQAGLAYEIIVVDDHSTDGTRAIAESFPVKLISVDEFPICPQNYTLEVTVSGQVDPRTGMVCNLSELDRSVQNEILERFDHENLHTREEFTMTVPTTENLSETIFNILKQSFTAAHLEKVWLEGTMMNSFEYAGDAELRV